VPKWKQEIDYLGSLRTRKGRDPLKLGRLIRLPKAHSPVETQTGILQGRSPAPVAVGSRWDGIPQPRGAARGERGAEKVTPTAEGSEVSGGEAKEEWCGGRIPPLASAPNYQGSFADAAGRAPHAIEGEDFALTGLHARAQPLLSSLLPPHFPRSRSDKRKSPCSRGASTHHHGLM